MSTKPRSRALATASLLLAIALSACGASAPASTADGGDVARQDGGDAGDGGAVIVADGGSVAVDGGGGGLGGRDGGLACDPSVPRTIPAVVNIYPDDGETPYVETIERAQHDLRVMVYLMGTGQILDALKRKAGEGKRVRVILDRGETPNMRYFNDLTAAGAQVIWSSDTFTYMHAKVIIADDVEAIVSSGNYAAFAIGRERNHSARLRDPDDLATL